MLKQIRRLFFIGVIVIISGCWDKKLYIKEIKYKSYIISWYRTSRITDTEAFVSIANRYFFWKEADVIHCDDISITDIVAKNDTLYIHMYKPHEILDLKEEMYGIHVIVKEVGRNDWLKHYQPEYAN